MLLVPPQGNSSGAVLFDDDLWTEACGMRLIKKLNYRVAQKSQNRRKGIVVATDVVVALNLR